MSDLIGMIFVSSCFPNTRLWFLLSFSLFMVAHTLQLPQSPSYTDSDKYFETHLSLSTADANALHFKYYREYGLAIEGLVRHHKVDALDYNRKVDDALPLEDVIKPNPELRKLLEDIDRSKIRMWLFTNAYVTHGKRVVKLLGIDDLFEGMTYCDYGAAPFACKPHPEMFDKAMKQAGIKENGNCYFVGE
jgi:pyrimidine and pyridine-specific 5'-nucleotidase